MAKVKSKNTTPELKLRRRLYKLGFRGYRVNAKLPGSPDIIFTKAKLAIFVDGCFWHGCPKCYSLPKENIDFWKSKLNNNLKRDKKVNQQLSDMGWQVVRFWEHSIEKNIDDVIVKISVLLKNAGVDKAEDDYL
jgi:DNA mismatch endonuclease, patch repair protein